MLLYVASKITSKGLKRVTKKGVRTAKSKTQTGIAKARQTAHHRIGHVHISEQDEEIKSAFQRLKSTKSQISGISKVFRKLYEARSIEASCIAALAAKFSAIEITENDPFGTYLQAMGKGLTSLEEVLSEHLHAMMQLVVPLEKFKNHEVHSIQKLKLKYRNTKTSLDIAIHKLKKAEEKFEPDAHQIAELQEKRDIAFRKFSEVRNEVTYQVNELETKKQISLLHDIEKYWSSYSSFASSQHDILSQHQVERVSYVPLPKITRLYMFAMDEEEDYLTDSYGGSNTMSEYSEETSGINTGITGLTGMPPPNYSDESDGEYEDEYFEEELEESDFIEDACSKQEYYSDGDEIKEEDYEPIIATTPDIESSVISNLLQRDSASASPNLTTNQTVDSHLSEKKTNDEIIPSEITFQEQEYIEEIKGASEESKGAQTDGGRESVQYLSIEEAKAMKSAAKETYLNVDDFQKVFGMQRSEFYELPGWRQKALKRSEGFF